MRIRSHLITFLSCTIAMPAGAAGLDLSQPLICAPREFVSCAIGGDCQAETAETVDAPVFLKISVGDKAISGIRKDGVLRDGVIENLKKTDTQVVLQGVEGPLGWSLTIATGTGLMTLAATGEGVGFVGFGVCTTR